MSYAIDFYFKHIETKEDAFFFVSKFISNVKLNSFEMISLEKGFIPTYNKHLFNLEAYEMTDENRFWLYSVFSFTFFYWEKYHILGLKGLSIPKDCKEMFDINVTFQDSSEQNYDYEDWGTNIVFLMIVS